MGAWATGATLPRREQLRGEEREQRGLGELALAPPAGSLLRVPRAGDDARGDTEDGWREAEALFATLKDEELIDPSLPGEQLLYRLFHEGGVTMDPIELLSDACTCNRERLGGTLQAMADESLRDMVEPDGTLKVDCQFCSREYVIPIDEVTRAAN